MGLILIVGLFSDERIKIPGAADYAPEVYKLFNPGGAHIKKNAAAPQG